MFPAPQRIALLSARDSCHPEGGGSEQYGEAMAAGLVAQGHEVTILTSRPAGSSASERRDGYTILRSGGRFTVYLRVLLRILLRRAGTFDVIVDVQNGTPFFARFVTRRPVVVLCHHVHREQWHMAFGDDLFSKVVARIGWWVESWLAPRALRGCRYITVSEVSRQALVELGVHTEDITVVYNGTPPPLPGLARSTVPEVVVLGRLVPHKRVEHAIRAVAALSAELPDLRLTVVGHGWWSDAVAAEVARCGVEDRVELLGFVDEARKHELLSRAWVLATPSVMEGWGLCVVEAASHGTPSVAYGSAGGLAESVLHGVTGLLCEDDEEAFTRALRDLLVDADQRARFGAAAELHAHRFTQEASVKAFADVLFGNHTARAPARTVYLPPSPRMPADDDTRQRVSPTG